MAVYRTWSVLPVARESETCYPSNAESVREANGHKDRQSRTIPVRICEVEGVWIVEADVPGISPDAIGIEFFRQRLTIRYERQPVADRGDAKFDDRSYGMFERVIRIADEIQTGGIVAKLDHGVLRLEIPKTQANRPRTIPVAQG